MGLAGTGSGDLIVENIFVPDYRMITRLAQREGTAPGTALHEDRIYASPFLTIGPTALACDRRNRAGPPSTNTSSSPRRGTNGATRRPSAKACNCGSPRLQRNSIAPTCC